MPRLLVADRWYDAINSHSWYEREYENLVVDRSGVLFPDWLCVRFTTIVEGEDGGRNKPDLALIDRHYRTWWVVEVELAHHDLYGHVLPQVETFKTGRYGADHADALLRARPELDGGRLRAMMSGEHPEVLVIVDAPVEAWRGPLRSAGIALAIVEPFRDSSNHLILRLNGHQPQPPSALLTRCSRHPSFKRLWRVMSPAALPPDDPLLIEWGGTVVRWTRSQLADGVLIRPDRGDVLAGVEFVELVQQADGRLAFNPISRARARRDQP
jgi:hypothetical protein